MFGGIAGTTGLVAGNRVTHAGVMCVSFCFALFFHRRSEGPFPSLARALLLSAMLPMRVSSRVALLMLLNFVGVVGTGRRRGTPSRDAKHERRRSDAGVFRHRNRVPC